VGTEFAGPPLSSERGIGALTMGGFLREVCGRFATREALCFHDRDGTVLRWTYADFQAHVDAISRALLSRGAGKGTRVALLMGNRPEWMATTYAVTSIGAVLIPVNTFYTADELAYVLQHSEAAVVICQEEMAGHRYVEQIAAIRGLLPALRDVMCLGTPGWTDFLAAGAQVTAEQLRRAQEAVGPDDDAVVIYTSGSTARPKAVLHGHRAPTLQSWRFVTHVCLDESVRSWSSFPFFWTAGFCMVMGGTLAAGGCCVLQERFEAGEALRLLETERVTTPSSWPHQTAALEDHPDWLTTDLSSIRHTESFSPWARHPSVHVEDEGWNLRSAYGLTETFTIISALPADTPTERREGNHGALLPGTVVRIVDPASGTPLGPDREGEIRVKGPTLMKGYLGVPHEQTFDADGFYATGDAGFVDSAGLLHWTGRTNDLIKTGGANVSPVEVEEVLLRHPDLAACLVVGVPDEKYGELVVLLTATHPGREVTEEGVQEWLRGRIASYKVPRRVLFIDEAELETTANAKLRTDAARRLAARQLRSTVGS
jgi:acyl-CoA synthetase (AMP-forming)/AMP-acid ligase II